MRRGCYNKVTRDFNSLFHEQLTTPLQTSMLGHGITAAIKSEFLILHNCKRKINCILYTLPSLSSLETVTENKLRQV